MKTSSCLGGRIQATKWLILAIRAVFAHFFEHRKSGRFTGFSGNGFRETGAESGPDWEWWRCRCISMVFFIITGTRPDTIHVLQRKDTFSLRPVPDSIAGYMVFFNPCENARAAARSFSSGLPLLIPPKSLRGPTVSHPLQENSSAIEYPRFTSFSFRAA